MTTPAARPLGACEALTWFAGRVCRNNVVSIAEVDGPLTPDAVRAALDALPSRHPLLGVRVAWDAERGGGPRFVPTDRPIPLRVVDGGDLVAHVESELEAGMPDEGPLARFVLVRRAPNRSTLLFVFHHAIGDGMSGAYVLRDVFGAAAAALAGDPVRYEPLASCDSVERHLPPQPGWVRRVWAIVKLFGRILKGGLPFQVPHDDCTPVPERRNRFAQVAFDPPFVTALVERARREGASVFGALSAAMMLALAAELPGRRSRMNCATAVNVRARVSPPIGESLGLYVSVTPVVVDVDASPDFWRVARDAKAALGAAMDRGDPLTIASFIGGMSNLVRHIARGRHGVRRTSRLVRLSGTPSFILSSLGVVPVARSFGPLEWRSLGFLAGGTIGNYFGASASTLGDVLRWSFVWVDPVVAEACARRLIERARATLVAAVESSPRVEPSSSGAVVDVPR